jgi:hypothetical protein
MPNGSCLFLRRLPLLDCVLAVILCSLTFLHIDSFLQMNYADGMKALDKYHDSKLELVKALSESGFERNTDETRVLVLQWIVARKPRYAGALGYRGSTVVVRTKHKNSSTIRTQLQRLLLLINGKTQPNSRRVAPPAAETDVAVFIEALRQFETKTAARAAFTQALKTHWDSRYDIEVSAQVFTRTEQDAYEVEEGCDDEDEVEDDDKEEEVEEGEDSEQTDDKEEEVEDGEDSEQTEDDEEEEKQGKKKKRKRDRRKNKRKRNLREEIDEEIEEAEQELVLLLSTGAGHGVGGVAGSLCDTSAEKVLFKLLAKAYQRFQNGGPAVVFLDIGCGDGIMLERALRSTYATHSTRLFLRIT